MIVLCFVAYYLPGFRAGGPLRTISNLVDRLGEEIDFYIITRDRDALDTQSYGSVQVNAWNRVGKAQVFYASSAQLSLLGIAQLIRETHHDVLYLNSFFDLSFCIHPLMARKLGLAPSRPCILAPRGEFSPGALSIKPAKKSIFLSAASFLDLYGDLTWQASSAMEQDDIRSSIGTIAERIVVAPDLPASPVSHTLIQPSVQVCRNPFPLRLVFISRITPKKNLDFLLQILANVLTPLTLDIFGPIRDSGYWSNCQELISCLPPHIKIAYRGELIHSDVSATFSCYDVFVFPTRGENYGHVILESLATGTPVVISDQTPWRGTDDHAVQEISLLDPKAWTAAIEDWGKLDISTMSNLRKSAFGYAQRFLQADEALRLNRSLFLTVTPPS